MLQERLRRAREQLHEARAKKYPHLLPQTPNARPVNSN